MKRAAPWSLVLALFPLLAMAAAPPAQEEKEDEQTTAAVRRFLAALKARDVAKMLAVCDVPWLDEGERVIKDRKELEKALKRLADRGAGAFAVDTIKSGPASKLFEDVESKKARALLSQVVGKGDQFAMFVSRKSATLRYLLVRRRGGEARVVGGPYRITYLLIDNRIPEAPHAALKKAERLELFSLEPEGGRKPPPKGKETFRGWVVLGKTVVKGKARDELVAAFEAGVAESIGTGALCFRPRHGIRVQHGGKTFDFVICFECLQTQIYDGKGARLRGVLHSDSPQPVFDKVLRDAGVPLAKKRRE
jgi:hypothetical protein